jgi:hypothetical protein
VNLLEEHRLRSYDSADVSPCDKEWLLAEHFCGADHASPVTFGVFRYAWSDLWGTIHLCFV